MFGPKETRIAEIYKHVTDMFSSNETFGNRLQLNSSTGSLIIRNLRSTDSGLYKLQIRSNRGNSDKTFNVTVYDASSNATHLNDDVSLTVVFVPSYGCKHEAQARGAYEKLMVREHAGFSCMDSGLWLNPKWPYMGSSPDGIVACDCHGTGICEIK
ncbi:hypothetical protein cypCar_00026959, partial [Cyprinus carpio]